MVACLLAQPFNHAVHDVDTFCLRVFRQSRHAHDLAHDDNDHLCTVVDDDVAHFQLENSWLPRRLRIGRERILRFGDADRIVGDSETFDLLDFLSANVV